jgi:hypothetical protein
VVHGQPVPPANHRPDLDAGLVSILDRALAKDPGARYPDARSFGAALDGWLATPTTRGGRRAAGPAVWIAGGLAVAVTLAAAAWLGGPFTRPAATSGAGPGPEQPAGAPLDGDLVVTISSDPLLGAVTKRGLSVDEEGGLPVIGGELVRLDVKLNRPAHVYLLWVDSQGRVQPCYPWDIARSDAGWQAPFVPGGGVPQAEVHCPDARGEGLVIEGPAGLETAVLLARSDPLPADVDLAGLTGRLPKSPLNHTGEVAWLDLGPGRWKVREVAGRHRGLKPGETRVTDAPLFTLLEERLRPHFELIKAVRFAHAEP